MPSSFSTVSSPATSTSALNSDASPSPPQDGATIAQTDGPCFSSTDPPQRRRSIKFNVTGSESRLKKRSEDLRRNALHRIPSPPPPSSYNRGVSFDTFDNRDATDFSLTLNYKHKDYKSTRRSRTFLCGTDQNDYSDFALEWLIDELVDDGDEIVCLRVVEKDSKIASDTSVEERKYRKEAEKLIEQIIAKNSQDEKSISLVMELAVGKVQEIIQRMIQIYEPAVLIVGTRGRSLGGMQGLLPGSVSKYCLQQSPIPVIVVRPSTKREKKKKKRQADPSRRSYNQILRMSETKAGRLFDKSGSDNSSIKLPEDEEAAAVANAITLDSSGNATGRQAGRSKESLVDHGSDCTTGDDDDDDDGSSSWRKSGSSLPNPESPTLDFSSVVLKSPALGVLDSLNLSDDTNDADEGDDEDEGFINNDGSRMTPINTIGNGSDSSFISGSREGSAIAVPQKDSGTIQVDKKTIPTPETVKSIPDIAIATPPTTELADRSTSGNVDKDTRKTEE